MSPNRINVKDAAVVYAGLREELRGTATYSTTLMTELELVGKLDRRR